MGGHRLHCSTIPPWSTKLEREVNLSNLVSFRYRVGAEQRVYHMVCKVRSFGSALNGSTDSGVLKFQLVEQPLFTVTHLIVLILFEFTLVRVEIVTPIPPPESALWAVPTLLLVLLLGSRWRPGGGRGRGGVSVGGQGVRGAVGGSGEQPGAEVGLEGAVWGEGVMMTASGACRSGLGLGVSAVWGEGVMMTALWGGGVVLAASGA